jgi:hypothetical protein
VCIYLIFYLICVFEGCNGPSDRRSKGGAKVLQRIGRSDPTALHHADENGWLPLHEAVRAGHVEAVQIILLNGGNINHLAGSGQSPLNIAVKYLGKEHEMIAFLRKNGGINVHPEN